MKPGRARGVPRNHQYAKQYMNADGMCWDAGAPIRMRRSEGGLEPALCMTPLDPLQLESWIGRLRSLKAAAPERSERSLLSAAGLRGLPLEQVVTAYEAEA